MFGRWTISARWYAEEVCRWRVEVGNLQWATIMDWMCEPFIIEKTGFTVADHQKRTIDNYFELHRFAPEVPWVPVLQGFRFDDYLNHLEQYERAGIRLGELPLVGLGSVCRRQNTGM